MLQKPVDYLHLCPNHPFYGETTLPYIIQGLVTPQASWAGAGSMIITYSLSPALRIS
jgi:hypothetical protein